MIEWAMAHPYLFLVALFIVALTIESALINAFKTILILAGKAQITESKSE